MRVASVLWIVPANVSLRILYFQRQQVGFVEKENDGNALKRCVVDYRVENIFRFFEAIRSTEEKFILKKKVFQSFFVTYRSSAST